MRDDEGHRITVEGGTAGEWHEVVTDTHNPASPRSSNVSVNGQREDRSLQIFSLSALVLLSSGLALYRGAGDEETNVGLAILSALIAAVIVLRALLVWFLRPFVEMIKR